MTIKIALFLSICLCITSCFLNYPACPVDYFQPFETTVKVVDRDGKPVKNKKVEAIQDYQDLGYFSENSGSKFEVASNITDNSGKVVLKYVLSHNCSQTHYGIIYVKGDSLFQPVNAIFHLNNEKDKVIDTIKLSKTIIMDSLVPFKVRIKSAKTNINKVEISWRTLFNDTTINRTFLSSTLVLLPSPLDTTITARVFSKERFQMFNTIWLQDGSQIKGKNNVIDGTVNRNIIFIDEIN